MKRNSGFTLIELLIVVAIIGILAAIAVPNFLNAQTRARVARVMGDHKALGTALEMYSLDNNNFPWPIGNGQGHSSYSVYIEYLHELTTPTPYIASVSYTDIFKPQREKTNWYPDDTVFSYQYVSYNGSWARLSNVSAAMNGTPVTASPVMVRIMAPTGWNGILSPEIPSPFTHPATAWSAAAT